MSTNLQTPPTDVRSQRYARSQELIERASRTTPAGVHSSFRLKGSPTPLVYERAEGSRLWDVDGNCYVDYAMAFGPHVLGHGHPAVTEAVASVLGTGQLWAGQHLREIELVEEMVEILPNAERIRLGQSGTEMDQLALRLARAATGRRRVIRFAGHYHGWLDPLFVDPATDPYPAQGAPLTPGQSAAAAADVVVIPWNDVDAVAAVFDAHDDVAAVFMEPILSNVGMIMPRPGYIEAVRELCEKNGALLVLDEVITGFRVRLGGAQELLDVRGHLTVYAKAMASGFPVAALAGPADVMDLLATPAVMHGGTYNTGISAVAAALATVRVLRDTNPYPQMMEVGGALIDGIRALAQRHGVELSVDGIGPVFQTRFGPAGGVHDRQTYMERSDPALADRFLWALQDRGVRITHRGTWFLSASHTHADVEETLEAVDGALGAL